MPADGVCQCGAVKNSPSAAIPPIKLNCFFLHTLLERRENNGVPGDADAENAATDAFDKGFYFVHVRIEALQTSKSFIFISQIGRETKQARAQTHKVNLAFLKMMKDTYHRAGVMACN